LPLQLIQEKWQANTGTHLLIELHSGISMLTSPSSIFCKRQPIETRQPGGSAHRLELCDKSTQAASSLMSVSGADARKYRAWSCRRVLILLCRHRSKRRGITTAPDGKRMSINVEILGGSPMVQHYLEEISERQHLRLVSNSDVFTPTGRIKVGVIWELSVKRIDDQSCEFTNMVHSSATPELLEILARQGIPWDVFRSARKPISEAHNKQETPLLRQEH
jgi:hypothetical protein